MTATGLEVLAEKGYAYLQEHGVTPLKAAEAVFDSGILTPEELEFAAVGYIGSLINTLKTADLAAARRGRSDGSGRAERINKAVESMEATLSYALDVLSSMKMGADGKERSLGDMSIGDHEYRAGIEASIESGARDRKDWHVEAVSLLRAKHARTIRDLPLSEQYALARKLAI